MIPNLCLLINLASTWGMVGLIWIVQLVHYPMFASLDSEQFSKHMDEHQRMISLVVLPLMLAELLSGVALWIYRPTGVPSSLVLTGLALLTIAWASTFFIQVPQHTKLLEGYDADVCQKLVLWNWGRSLAWSLRGLLTAWMMWLVIAD